MLRNWVCSLNWVWSTSNVNPNIALIDQFICVLGFWVLGLSVFALVSCWGKIMEAVDLCIFVISLRWLLCLISLFVGFLKVYVPPHPLIKHWVSVLRNEQTPCPIFSEWQSFYIPAILCNLSWHWPDFVQYNWHTNGSITIVSSIDAFLFNG